jgi:hypothetical protein
MIVTSRPMYGSRERTLQSSDHVPDEGPGDPTASRGGNDVHAPEPGGKLAMRFHVVVGQRGGADRLPIIQGDDGHRDPIGIHPGPDMVEPAIDSPTRVMMSPLAEVPLRHDRRKVRAVGKRLDPRATADQLTVSTALPGYFRAMRSAATCAISLHGRSTLMWGASWPAATRSASRRRPTAAGSWPSSAKT